MKSVEKWTRRLQYIKLSKYIILICFFLSISIIGLTYYGSSVGNFLITIERQSIANLQLSETAAFNDPSGLLQAKGVKDLTNATLYKRDDENNIVPAHIPANIDERGDGSHNDETYYRYFAYTFYLRNVSQIAFYYRVQITIKEMTQGVESAVRVMVIRDGERVIFAKPQETGDDIGKPETNEGLYEVENFVSERIVCDFTVDTYFQPMEVDKFTVVMWLEGWDPQCIDSIKGGTLRMEMRFFALDNL